MSQKNRDSTICIYMVGKVSQVACNVRLSHLLVSLLSTNGMSSRVNTSV